MRLVNRMKEKRDKCYVACPTNALESAVLTVVRSINIHQDDHCHFLPSYPLPDLRRMINKKRHITKARAQPESGPNSSLYRPELA